MSDLGDHIGMESCVDLETDTIPPSSSRSVHPKPWGINSRRSLISNRKCKELPPPMPIQSSTVMKRYYTDDGRLVITEEKIKSPKFHFTSVRSHGRLTIQLVNSDSKLSCDSENREENEVCDSDSDSDVAVLVSDGDSGGGKCFKYNAAAVRGSATGPCLFVNQNQLHAIRPVQI